MTHTPGPWTWRYDTLLSSGGVEVLDCNEHGYDGMFGGTPPAETDARLIAAAPDLLAALEAILAALEAIRFAVEINEPLSHSIEHELQVIGERARAAIATARASTASELGATPA